MSTDREKPAIILITCDEMRRDTLGFYGNQAITTPNIDGLAGQSLVFDECFTTPYDEFKDYYL